VLIFRIGFFLEISDVILILHQALHDKFYEDNQHEHDFESNELEDVVKQNEERIEEEQEIVVKASGLGIPSMAISPTDTALDKRQSLVSSFVFGDFSFLFYYSSSSMTK